MPNEQENGARSRGARTTARRCCAVLALLAAAPTTAESAGAPRSDEVRQYIERVARDPVIAEAPVTLILESDPARLPNEVLAAHGTRVRYRFGRLHEISLPGKALGPLLEHLPPFVLARFPYPHRSAAVTGQGVSLTGAGDMQALGYAGAGVTIGIIDLGFGGVATAQANGDLPAEVTVIDYTGTGTGGTSHGTQVAEIVHEMAPGASLRLARINTETQLAQAVSDLQAAGATVINHSVVWFNAAFYDGTGTICDIANSAGSSGVHWVNAAGNHRNKHYLGIFTDADDDMRHEFAAGQNANTISLSAGSAVSLFLNWDAYPQTTIDYDLHLYHGHPDSGGVLVASSINRQSGKGASRFPYPYETISYTPTTSGTYYIVVRKASAGTTHVRLTLFSHGPDLAIRTTSSSLLQPADCAQVIGVGATNLSDLPGAFSSEGPTTDGRPKPEVAAPTGVTTSFTSAFGGTSAAAPHVAGAMATLVSQDPAASPAIIRSRLTDSAKDVHTTGFDYRTGYGRLSLDADRDGHNHDSDNCPLAWNPDPADIDGDGLGDACDSDIDGDGLSNEEELALGTDSYHPDTDGDGLTDWEEVHVHGTDPRSPDTDADGVPDASDPLPLLFNHADGDLAPAGAPDGMIDAADYALMQQIVLGTRAPTSVELAHGDMYPPAAPDGRIDLSDLIMLLNRIREATD